MPVDTFSDWGQYEWTAPAGTQSATIRCWGAFGSSGFNSETAVGGHIEATFDVSQGETFNVFVGGSGNAGTSDRRGYNGGGTGAPETAGGGMSDVRFGSTNFSDAIIVAGGAGGSGFYDTANSSIQSGGNGGAGGADTGHAGIDASTSDTSATGGGGGSQSAGGSSGSPGGAAGSQGSGGQTGYTSGHSGGDGGAGYYGGGAGGVSTAKVMGDEHVSVSGGGGGSNYVDDTLARFVSLDSNQRGINPGNSGDGLVEIEYVQQTTTIGGTCIVQGNGVEGAVIHVVRTDDNTLQAEVTSGTDGSWSADVPINSTYHVAASYDDGTDQYNEYSYPFLVT